MESFEIVVSVCSHVEVSDLCMRTELAKIEVLVWASDVICFDPCFPSTFGMLLRWCRGS